MVRGAYLPSLAGATPLTVKSLKRAEVAWVSGCVVVDALGRVFLATNSRTLVNGCGCAALEATAASTAAIGGAYGPMISVALLGSHDGIHVPTVVHVRPS